ncbi:MAG: TIGR03557 family F420-dependent LLM class oxidoreductase [Methanomicrobiaceae archaeon]|uniref:Luciferase-like domain-containing protein n=1 Tax=hydrocarbon metagenome TaxID=938273 RepID=A0A0W8FLJ5_9ZZZZ|nr:TIGR03557 family F420-dependent LLM class oxidoreductase [Methanomicrobiaceae archaeon]
MVGIGFKLFTEAHSAPELVKLSKQAEDAGFSFVSVSDHFHPWISNHGRSGFAWCTIGGIAEATSRIRVATGVTCPLVRYHPAIVAQAAATAATMMPGRFELGLGTGEDLNEHITGGLWPASEPVRLDMLREAVRIIRTLWSGGMKDYYGTYYTVDNAELFELPEQLPEIRIAAQGAMAAGVAGEIGDALIHFEDKPEEVIQTFRSSGGEGKSCMVEFAVCYGRSEEEAKRTAYEWFPIAANQGELNWVLPTHTHFEQLQQMVTPEDIAEKVICGPDPEQIIKKIRQLADLGFDSVLIHQVGPDQQAFIDLARDVILPEFEAREARPKAPAAPGLPGR